MKAKLNILCILLLLAFAGCMYNGFFVGVEGSKDATHIDGAKLLYYVNVVPTKGNELNDSIPSILQKGEFLKYHTAKIKIEQETTADNELFSIILAILMVPCALMMVLALFYFFRLILSISKKDIFNFSNVRRLRFISITIIVMGIFEILKRYIDYDIATKSIQLSGYEIRTVLIPWNIFLVALLLAIFAEIYAQAIKLKEEQDLTI